MEFQHKSHITVPLHKNCIDFMVTRNYLQTNRGCLCFSLIFSFCVSVIVPISSSLQDEVNQIMETNLWLRHVSVQYRSFVYVYSITAQASHPFYVMQTHCQYDHNKKMCIAYTKTGDC